MQVGEPLRNVTGFMVVKQLIDTAATHARRRGDVSDKLDALAYVFSRVLSRSLCAQVPARSYREGAS
jgi:hypothetical protein